MNFLVRIQSDNFWSFPNIIPIHYGGIFLAGKHNNHHHHQNSSKTSSSSFGSGRRYDSLRGLVFRAVFKAAILVYAIPQQIQRLCCQKYNWNTFDIFITNTKAPLTKIQKEGYLREIGGFMSQKICANAKMPMLWMFPPHWLHCILIQQ